MNRVTQSVDNFEYMENYTNYFLLPISKSLLNLSLFKPFIDSPFIKLRYRNPDMCVVMGDSGQGCWGGGAGKW